MFILLTQFIYPIKKRIALSKHFGFYFDNARTTEEYETLRSTISRAWDLSEISDEYKHKRFPIKSEVSNFEAMTFEEIIEDFCNVHFSKEETKKIILDLEGDKDKIIAFYAKFWVIVRYGNQEMKLELSNLKKGHKEMKKDGKKGFFMLEDDHIFEKRNSYLINYSYIISLISGRDDYFGWNFLISDSRAHVDQLLLKKPIMTCILHQMIGLNSKADDSAAQEFKFDVFIDNVKPFVHKIDKALTSKRIDDELLLYIGYTLSSAVPFKNEYSSLVRLVGILEMLLTHQPDFNRFNVDESITKQFVLKTSLLAYMANPKIVIERTKAELKELYTQRSNIVHGNFKEVDKFIKKLKKEDRNFDELVSNCYSFAKLCITKYLDDPLFMKFLKES